MPQHALKEWAVTIAALAAGDQVLIVRKGGIGEKRFELPHPSFYLFPTYAHQRPELVKAAARDRFADPLAQREDPAELPLAVHAELVSSHPIADPDALAAIDHLHVLAPTYAEERLKWRRKHPLWAAVLRVSVLPQPPVLHVLPEHGGCVSWVDLPEYVGAPQGAVPALSDDEFARAEADVEAALAAAGVTGVTRAHVLVCRGPDCTSRGAQDVYTEMAAQRHAQGLEEDDVVQSQTGCIGPLCGQGPVVCSYPTGAWYAHVGVADVAEIVARDLGEGAVVERLEARRLEGAA